MNYARPLHRFGIVMTAESPVTDFTSFSSRVREAFQDYRLVILRGITLEPEKTFSQFCQTIFKRDLLQWESGEVMEMRPSDQPKNYLFSTERVPFHWDGAFHQVPSILAFQCLEAPRPKSGGETLFTNTELVVKECSSKERAQWEKIRLTYKTEKVAHYGGKFTTSLIEKHPERGTEVLRFAEEVKTELNPVSLAVTGIKENEVRTFVSAMRRRIYHPSYCYTHTWRTGDIVFADNHALIHARHAFLRETRRHLRRVQIL